MHSLLFVGAILKTQNEIYNDTMPAQENIITIYIYLFIYLNLYDIGCRNLTRMGGGHCMTADCDCDCTGSNYLLIYIDSAKLQSIRIYIKVKSIHNL